MAKYRNKECNRGKNGWNKITKMKNKNIWNKCSNKGRWSGRKQTRNEWSYCQSFVWQHRTKTGPFIGYLTSLYKLQSLFVTELDKTGSFFWWIWKGWAGNMNRLFRGTFLNSCRGLSIITETFIWDSQYPGLHQTRYLPATSDIITSFDMLSEMKGSNILI